MANQPDNPGSFDTTLQQSVDLSTKKSLIALVRMVRDRMRDYEELNRLIEGVENSNRSIAMALLAAVDDWNMTPPLIAGVTISSHPSPTLLVDGAIAQLLRTQGLLQMRNTMQYSDGQGMAVSISEKSQANLSASQLFKQDFEQKKITLKRAINLNAALGGVGIPSEFAIISGTLDWLDTEDF